MTSRPARFLSARITLATAALTLLLATWGPQLPLPVSRFHGVLVHDITQSMNAEDYVVGGKALSRLAAAKLALRGALEALPCGSRVGLGVFTEYRTMVLIAPLEVCANFRELTSTLERIDGRMAWAGASEVAKGIYSAIRAARALPEHPVIVFLTDGHEAPPVHPGHRPPFDGQPGEITGLIVGTGGLVLVQIPKFDPDGRRLGFWRPDDVMQTDPYSKGRGGSVANERFADIEDVKPPPGWPVVGHEHLSQLHEGYLRLLADELRFDYLRLDSASGGAEALSDRMQERPLARFASTRVSLRPLLGVAGLIALVWQYAAAAFSRRGSSAARQVRADWLAHLRPRREA